jgi:hypothetical protein
MVYTFYVVSMVLYMLRSRCQRVGEQLENHFEPEYMSMMATKIAQSIDLQVPFPKEYYVNKERMIRINTFIEVKIILNEKSFEEIAKKKHNIQISREKAAEWIKENVVGRITKADLDNERVRENNVLDMMENTCILDHPESINETQIACLLFFYSISSKWQTRENYNYGQGIQAVDEDAIVNFGRSYQDFSMVVLFMLLFEHILSYIFTFVKRNDLKNHGQIGSNGILSTPLCKVLDGISFFIQCITALLAILHFV